MKRSRLTFFLIAVVIFLPFAEQVQAQPPKEITNSIGMKLVLIPNGAFMMGSPEIEARRTNQFQHQVTISKGNTRM